jgi:hypothetical protein
MNDAEILGSAPDYVSIGGIFKATPHSEGDRRFVYFEASNEGLDQQGEVIVAKALHESSDYFLRYGNVDIDHLTKIGPKLGIPDAARYEIGLPVEVRQDGNSTFVKSEIFTGDGQIAEKANMYWDSLTKLSPPQRWYPSVGGQSLAKAIEVDPKTQGRKVVIKKVRWFNIGMSKTPVNQHVGTCATMPVGAFAKAMSESGLDIAKALEAGYGTDSASLTGGAALRKQSLYGTPANYFDWRNQISKAMRDGRAGRNPDRAALVKFSSDAFGIGADQSAEYVERFVRDIKDGIKRRNS